ncbi:MAG: hypothetical protein EOM34_16400 [Clostridia bacterium]|nr:hypothetical protein [Clostridia bacterium]
MENKFDFGNRCGFSPDLFRQPTPLSPDIKSRMPKFINQIQSEIKANGVPGLAIRGERDESVRALLCVLLDYCDLWTCKIGIPTKKGWLAFGWKTILNRLPWLSESRLYEALGVIRKNGLFDSNQRLSDPRFITKDATKKSGYSVSDKGFTEVFWTAFRQTKRWKHEAEAKAKRTAEQAAKAGKNLQDFYKKVWCSTTKAVVKQMAAAGIVKTETHAPVAPSANAVKMMLHAKLAELGFKDAYVRAQKLFEEFGAAALINTEQFVS